MSLRVTGTVTLLQVFDMPTSLHFYRDLLGFEIFQRSQDHDNCGWAWLRLNDTEIMLNTAYEDADRPRAPDLQRQKAHDDTCLFFGCPDVDAAFAFLRTQGIAATEPKTAYYGMRQVWFHDPDGYGLCLQWPDGESADRRVARPEAVRGGDDEPESRLARLERQGLLRRASASPSGELLTTNPPRPSNGASALEALLEERRTDR